MRSALELLRRLVSLQLSSSFVGASCTSRLVFLATQEHPQPKNAPRAFS